MHFKPIELFKFVYCSLKYCILIMKVRNPSKSTKSVRSTVVLISRNSCFDMQDIIHDIINSFDYKTVIGLCPLQYGVNDQSVSGR